VGLDDRALRRPTTGRPEKGRRSIRSGDTRADRDASLHVSPRRVLAECEAKRRIVELAQGSVTEIAWTAIGCSETTDPGDTEAPEKILRALALPYAEHPDYREGWKV
jgi:hypothetical protein